MKRPSQMNHQFSQVPKADIPRSAFNRSHGYKTTFDAGYLVPILVDEALPGDTFTLNMSQFTRLATPITPIMDNIFLDVFFFAVPNRLVWDNWEKFNGAQTNPGDSTDYLVPIIDSGDLGGYAVGSVYDYMGLPTQVQNIQHSALPLRAYNLIWNEWFRDQNLQDSVSVPKGDGPDDDSLYSLLRRGKRHDYFTSALPFPQKGPAVALPLGTEAPIERIDNAPSWFVYKDGTNNNSAVADITANGPFGGKVVPWDGAAGLSFDPNGGLYADLSTATAATINQLREAFQVQKLYERDARGGTRYVEILKSHFGVTSPDYRLQRPEYLGGGSFPINVHPVAQNSESGTTPQGNLAAFATSSGSGAGFSKSFTEHCIIIGLIAARADLSYQQGLDRMWSRSTRFDFYWPALSHIGEQAILNKEIYAVGSAVVGQDDQVFGYQERYAEYRYKPSKITGQFRSTYAQSLDIWHLAQDFGSLPVLNDEFIVENPPIDRVIATPTEPHFLFDAFFQMKCARPMPVYSVPGLIDHF